MRISVAVHPNSKRPRTIKDSAGVLHIYVNQRPVDGKANEAVVKVLAEYFKTSKSNVKLLKGQTSKHKIFEIK